MPGLRVEFRRLQFLFGITLTLSLLLAQNAVGQASYTAQVRGTVTDPSGAVVQGATVTITNDGTNVSTSVQTDDHGLYLLAGLRPSTYTIKVEATGFRSAESKNVILAVDQQGTLNFSLKPVGFNITVDVTTAPPLLETDSAALGTDVSNEYVRDIPLYNRSLFGLVFLAGGVTETTGSGINDNYPSGTNFVSNGQRNATAQVSIDGSPLSAPEQGEGGNSNVYYQPSVEIVQEFKLQNNSFSAEFGNNGGTVVNIVLKQGTNKFHGSGWWYGQRSAFDARDFFNSGEKPDHLRDQYGFAVGGPIIKNRTFFFVDFEKTRQQDPVNIEGHCAHGPGAHRGLLAEPGQPAGSEQSRHRQRGHLRSLCEEHGPELRVSAPAIFGRRNSEQDSRSQHRSHRAGDLEFVPACQCAGRGLSGPELPRGDVGDRPSLAVRCEDRPPDLRQTQDRWPLQPRTQFVHRSDHRRQWGPGRWRDLPDDGTERQP